MKQFVSVFIWLFAVYTGPVRASQSQDYAIVPGYKIGRVVLHLNRQSVHKLLGTPMGTYPLPQHYVGEYWQANSGKTVRVFYRANQVIQVAVTSPGFATVEGLTVKSTLEDVQTYYTKLRKLPYFVRGSGGGLIDYYDDMQRGIAFAFTSPDREPVHFTLYAIIVHRARQKVIAEPDEQPR